MNNMIIRLWAHLTKQRKIQFTLFLVLTIFGSLLEVISLGAIIPFLAALSSPDKMLTFPIISDILIYLSVTQPNEIMLIITILFVFAAVTSGSIRLLILYISPKLAFMTTHDLGVKIYRLTLHQPYEKHLEKPSSEIIAGITAKTYTVSGILQAGINFVNSSALILFISTALVLLDPRIAVIAGFGIGGVYLIVTFFVRKKLDINSNHIGVESSQTIRALQEGLSGIRDIILDSSQDFYCNIYNSSDKKLRKAQSSNMFIQGSPRYYVETLGMIIIAGIALSLGNSPNGLLESLPILGALALGAQRLLPALQQVFGTWSLIRGHKRPMNDVLDLLDQPAVKVMNSSYSESLLIKDKIELKNVDFSYSSNNQPVLFDVNFSFPRGSKIAFIGTTGSGKSTIIDLLMGLLKPTKGEMLIDGVALDESRYSQWQKQIAHVPQKINLIDGTIIENIVLGSAFEYVDYELLNKVTEQAQLLDFINKRPDGYDTKVGEFGSALSGGQIQRIGIARALYKKASVLVLDEATSALDGVTENNMMAAISKSNKDLTIIIVTHRLSTVKDCDIIFELDSGKLVAKGTYNELIKFSSVFKKMVEV